MPDKKNATGAVTETAPEQNSNLNVSVDDLIFPVTPFTFEGKEYKEIDLRKLKDITTQHIERVEEALISEGKATQAIWTTIRGATLLAAVANDMPFDWLDNAKAKDVVTIRNAVFAFFIGLV